MENTFILPLDSLAASLDTTGGKGSNLSLLARAGFPVPPGFHITTAAYQRYTAGNELDSVIDLTLDNLTKGVITAEDCSQNIRSAFKNCSLPPEIAEQVLQAYRAMDCPCVAVRSSATAEDLPELSFAGQQDTFLNILGEDSLLQAVVDCWSSLWTARAISYRSRNNISHKSLSLAVIVQQLIESEVSGVLFTANPLSGIRSQSVINASFGLGEAIVSGAVEPDEIVVDHLKSEIVSLKTGSKSLKIIPQQGGGTVQVPVSEPRQALTDTQILELAGIGQKIAGYYTDPQDIEWAVAGGKFFILQSRPITSLYPIPEDLKDTHLRGLVSFGAVQGIMDPITPLGQDVLKLIFSGGARLFGYQQDYKTDTPLHTAAQRLFVDVTPIFTSSVGQKLGLKALTVAEPAVKKILQGLTSDPSFQPDKRGISLKTIFRFLHFILPRLARAVQFVINPEKNRQKALEGVEQYLSILANDSNTSGTVMEKFAARAALIHKLDTLFPLVVPVLVPALVAGIGPLYILTSLAGRLAKQLEKPEIAHTAMEVTRGMPNNVTTQMDLELWKTAKIIGTAAANLHWMDQHTHDKLADQYLSGRLPGSIAGPVTDFLNQYGMRGAGEIDFGRQRWRENPAPVMQSIKNYLTITDDNQAPDAVFQRGEQQAAAAIRELADAARKTRFGTVKAWFINKAARRIRALAGLRESPKFTIIRAMGIIRSELLLSGGDLVQVGLLKNADDLFFLYYEELKLFANGTVHNWKEITRERRAAWDREKLRRQIPRLILTDGRAFYEGLDADSLTGDHSLFGSPVSAGLATGRVRVILDPYKADLQAGEILVCPGTDPSWTPLFLLAGALVMEVGGLMTHGAVVAREYGIPAVVGVHQATTRLKNGMLVSVDGSSGAVTILDDDALQTQGQK